MADTKISALDAAGALTGAELLALVQSGGNAKLGLSDLADYVRNGHPGYVSGGWYPTVLFSGNSAAPQADEIVAYPFRVAEEVSIRGLGVGVNVGESGANVKLAVYNNASGAPSSLLAALATPLSIGTGNAMVSADLAADETLYPDRWYWAATLCDTNCSNASAMFGVTGGMGYQGALVGDSTLRIPNSSYNAGSYQVVGAGATYAGGFPSTFGAVTRGGTSAKAPQIFLQKR